MSSKSANYCFANRSKDTGLLLLCEARIYIYLIHMLKRSIRSDNNINLFGILYVFQVSLGNMNELLDADYRADQLPTGKHSVKGMGAVAPNPSKTFTT